MDPDKIKTIVSGALELAGDQREAFIAGQCGDDPATLAEARLLLRAALGAERAEAVTNAGATETFLPSAAAITERPGTVIGRYKLLQLIGQGGFGSVFMAEQTAPIVRRVALKIIKLGMDTRGVIARFEAERQALAMMDHPNIARVLDAGATDTGRPYFVMELVTGDPITAFADTNKLSIKERLELVSQVCSAVQHAHHKGVIHRDLKPSNILVNFQDGEPYAKVIDFGIAKATATRLTDKTLFTELRQLIGTPMYMSPEQASGSLDIDTRTDIYSLGVLLYELLAGSTPFSSKEMSSAAYEEIRRIIREVDPPKPSLRLTKSETLPAVAAARRMDPAKLNHALRGELDWIVMKALDKDRKRRYASAAELADDLRRYLAGEPIVAAPPNALYRLHKFSTRHRMALVTLTAILIVLIAGIIVSTSQALRAHRAEQTVLAQLADVERERREAQKQRDEALEANHRAEEQTAKVKRMAASHCAEEGLRAEQDGDPGLALLWFARAVKIDGGAAEAAAVDRMRFGMAYRQLPQPLDVTPFDVPGAVCNGLAMEWGPRLVLLDARTRRPVSGKSVLYDGAVNFAQFSPDGRLVIAACTDDNLARLFVTATGQLACEPMPHDYRGYISFTPDGRYLVTLNQGNILLRSVTDGKVARPALPTGWCKFSPDGGRAMIRESAGSRVWDTATGKALTPYMPSSSYRVAMSADGTRVATTGTVCRVWDAATGAAVSAPMEMPEAGWCVAEFSPDGKSLLLGAGHTWRVWNSETGVARLGPIEQAGDAFWGAWSRDGTRIATTSVNAAPSRVVVRSATTGRPLCGPIYRNAERFQFSSDGAQLVTVPFFGGPVEVWDIAGTNPLGPFVHGPFLDNVFYSGDGTRLGAASAVDFQFVRTWEAATGEEIAPPFVRMTPGPHGTAALAGDVQQVMADGMLCDRITGLPVRGAALPAGGLPTAIYARSGDGKLVLGRDDELKLHLWNTATGKEVALALPVFGRRLNTIDAQFSPDGRQMALVCSYFLQPGLSNSQAVLWQLWNVGTGERVMLARPVFSPVDQGDTPPALLRFSADGQLLLLVSYRTHEVCAWNTQAGEWVVPDPKERRDDPGQLFWSGRPIGNSSDGQRVLMASDTKLYTWELPKSLALLKPISVGGPIPLPAGTHGAEFSADARFVAIYGGAGIELWDVASGQKVADSVSGGNRVDYGDVTAARFAPDGRWLLTMAPRGATSWDISACGGPAEQLDLIGRYLSNRHFSDDPLREPERVTTPDTRIDETFVEPELTAADLRRRLLDEAPGLFRTRDAAGSRPRAAVSNAFKQIVQARLAAATEAPARAALAGDLAAAAVCEGLARNPDHAWYLAEIAAKLDASSLGVQDALALAYIGQGRTAEALAIYQRCRGQRFHAVFKYISVGDDALLLIPELRAEGNTDPNLGAMERLLTRDSSADPRK